MKKIPIILMVMMCVMVSSIPAEAQSALDLHLVTFLNENDYKLIAVNNGKSEITILTKNLGWGTSSEPGSDRIGLNIRYTAILSFNKHQLIDSLPFMGPVVLRPNEAAIIDVDWEEVLPEVQKILPQNGVLFIDYHVSPKHGERFGVWSGSASAKPLKIVDKKIVIAEP